MLRNLLARRNLYRRRFIAMGSRICVSVAPVRGRSTAQLDVVVQQVQDEIIQFGRDAWAWGNGSLASFNRSLLAGEVATIPTAIQPLFARAFAIHQASAGWFEPRLAALVQLWGFDQPAHLKSAPPTPAEIAPLIAALRAAPAYDGGLRYGPAPRVALDFGAIGKGYIVDLALARLAAAGYPNASIDAGGHVGVRGRRGGQLWRVGIREPWAAPASDALLASLQVSDESVVTHGTAQRYFEHQGQRYAHLLDPHTGWPVQGLSALTVVHADGCVADAAGAALFVAGRERWPALARQLGINKVLAVGSDQSLQVSAELAPLLSWTQPMTVQIVD